MKTQIACGIYLASMVAANAIVGHFGPWVSPILAFVLIGLDLALRDWLHVRLTALSMGALIVASGVLTWILNAAPAQIAIASAASFVAAASVDWGVFSWLRDQPWLKRANASNVAGAAVDSIVFPTIAFGVLLPHIILLQFAAKVAGGALWAWVLRK